MFNNHKKVNNLFFAFIISTLIYTPAVLSGDDPKSEDPTSLWEMLKHPVVGSVIMVVSPYILNGLFSAGEYIYINNILNEKERQKHFDTLNEQKKAQQVERQIRETELAYRQNPEWQRIIIEKQKQLLKQDDQSLTINGQIIRQNELELTEKERKNDQEELEHYKQLLSLVQSPEERTELEKIIAAEISKKIHYRFQIKTP